jgi:hypothetical protein
VGRRSLSSVTSRLTLDNPSTTPRDPLTRLATLATVSPKGAQRGEGIVKNQGQDTSPDFPFARNLRT